jgi:hypothetical protein
MTVSKAGASPAWPAVTVRARGRAWPSAARWILVLSPPRERPSAWSVGTFRPSAPFSVLRRRAGGPGRRWSRTTRSSRCRRRHPLPRAGISGSIRYHIASVITNRTGMSDQLMSPLKRHDLREACRSPRLIIMVPLAARSSVCSGVSLSPWSEVAVLFLCVLSFVVRPTADGGSRATDRAGRGTGRPRDLAGIGGQSVCVLRREPRLDYRRHMGLPKFLLCTRRDEYGRQQWALDA